MAYQFETVKLDKGMYSEAGRSFTKVLEKCDPSEQYKGTPLEHLDAFQRQLKRFDIKVKGADSDVVSKFFASWESAVLFPEYVARAVRQGMEENNILPLMTAAETRISGMDYRSIASTPTEEEKSLKMVAEGAMIPETRVSAQENLVKLHKRGRMLVASYEAIQFQRLDLFSVTLRQIGAYINRMHVADAIDVICNGDGNKNGADQYTVGTKPIAGTAGTLSYDALVDFATVNVHVSEVYKYSDTEELPENFGDRLSSAMSRGWHSFVNGMEDFAVALAYSWMWLILWAVIIVTAVVILRKIRRRSGMKKPLFKKKNDVKPDDKSGDT